MLSPRDPKIGPPDEMLIGPFGGPLVLGFICRFRFVIGGVGTCAAGSEKVQDALLLYTNSSGSIEAGKGRGKAVSSLCGGGRFVGSSLLPAGASASRHPNPLVGVPYFQQRDSTQLCQRDRTCFSSSCAMLLEALKPGTLEGANGDDAYLAVVQRYGDTTDAGAQLQVLAHYGITARLVQTADFQLIKQQIARDIPVPCGSIHRCPVDRPTGSGHWLIVVCHTPTHLVVNDPWGEPDLLSGATLNANGMGLRFSRQNDRCAGLRLRKALDGGADRRQCLPLCPGKGQGGGGGSSGLRTQRAIARF